MSGAPVRRRRALVALLAAPWAAWAIARTLGLDAFHPAVALMSFTPLVAATAVVPLAVALVARRWLVAAVAAAALVALVLAVAPRALEGPNVADAGTPGRRLVVMSTNLHLGQADPRAILRLVREQHVDVLSLEELTAGELRRLDAAGARALLPNRVLRPGTGSDGTGLMARQPLAAIATAAGVSLQAALGADGLRFVSVHPFPPLGFAAEHDWQAVLRGLPGASQDRRAHVLLGDFNATLDHRELRRLLDRGYSDAADATGDGLVPTFPTANPLPPMITIDHVLFSAPIRARRFSAHDIAGSDHRAIVAELVVPQH